MRHELFDVFLLMSCAFAVWKGGGPERMAAIALFLGDILSVAAVLLHSGRYRHEEYGLFVVDVILFIALAAIAFRSTRWWPLVLAGLQLDGTLVHLLHWVAPHAVPVAYLDATALWSYPMVALLFVGAWRHQTRRARRGDDPAWKSGSPDRPSVIPLSN